MTDKRETMNLIVICLDTLRYDVLKHTHPVEVATPTLDALAAESAVFTAAFGEGEPTIPVRRALFTGNRSFPWRFDFDTGGAWPSERGWHRIPMEQSTLAETLLQHGYKTAMFSDTYHMFKPTMNFTRGFINYEFIRGQETDNWKGGTVASVAEQAQRHMRGEVDPAKDGFLLQYLFNNCWRKTEDDWTSARLFRTAADWLSANHTEQPFFMWIDSFDPHEPWDPPRKYANQYYPDPGEKGKEFIMPANYGGDATQEEAERIKALYYGEVTFVDHLIGRFYDRLQKLGLLDNTMIIVISDHGTELMDHGRWGKSPPNLFAHNTQLNWMIRHPDGLGRGRQISEFVQNHDFTPTTLALMGIACPDVDGRDITPWISGEHESGRDHIITGWGSYAAVRDREWNYVVNYEDPDAYLLLYNLSNDPLEQRNVTLEHPEVVARQRKRLEDFLGQPLPAKLSDRTYPSRIPIRAYYGARIGQARQE